MIRTGKLLERLGIVTICRRPAGRTAYATVTIASDYYTYTGTEQVVIYTSS